ncbi:MAG: hypothetical protein J0H40_03990 [Rhizobiales bacterium]|nr:hypothetical protein [Hyphomicrobiales bacterium]
MAITWIDGFEDYDSSNGLLSQAYTTAGLGSITYGSTGRFSGSSLNLGFVTTAIRKGISTTSTVAVGHAFKLLLASGGATVQALAFRDASANTIAGLFFNPDGGLVFVRGSTVSSNVLATAPSGTVSVDAWYYLEVEFTRHASAGAVNVYLNGALIMSASGVNTGAADVAAVAIIAPVNGYLVDDLYITDTASRIGEVRIDTLVPTADTAQKDFTASTGSDNYAMVGELPVDGDTSYVQADVAGAADLYTTDGLADTPDAIYAVQVRVAAKKLDTGFRSIKAKLKSGTTEADGAAVALATDYAVATAIHETDPATDAAWTASGVNAAQIGMEIG